MEVHNNYLRVNMGRQELNCNIYHTNNYYVLGSDEIHFCRTELSILSSMLVVEELVFNTAGYNRSVHNKVSRYAVLGRETRG